MKVYGRRKGIEGVIGQTVVYICLILVVITVMLPIIITFMFSLKTNSEHIGGVWTMPKSPQWHYYGIALNNVSRGMISSLLVCITTTAGVVFFSAITAYVFVRHDFFGKDFLFTLVISLMMIPAVLTMTPQYLTVLNLGIYNTRWALILPGIAGGQVGAIFLFRTFFSQQPSSLFESAKLDGANDIVMFFEITLPLAVPVLIIQALGTFSLMYNDFLWPTLVIKNTEVQTLMPQLKAIAEKVNMSTPGVSYAMYLVAGIPLIIVSLCGLRFFVNGDFASGMKL
ncbi:MAG: carbohydrate ABC transporter permease [Clostridia bacterium]|nr:carbohydrate ABC transporter permease [Clostridia bacterium]